MAVAFLTKKDVFAAPPPRRLCTNGTLLISYHFFPCSFLVLLFCIDIVIIRLQQKTVATWSFYFILFHFILYFIWLFYLIFLFQVLLKFLDEYTRACTHTHTHTQTHRRQIRIWQIEIGLVKKAWLMSLGISTLN